MIVRLGAAMCVAVAVFACSTASTSIVKSGSIARGATAGRALAARAAAERGEKDPNAVVKIAEDKIVESNIAEGRIAKNTKDNTAADKDANDKAAADKLLITASLTASVEAANPPATGAVPAGAVKMSIGSLIARALSAGATIKGVASTYNPFRVEDKTAGSIKTASGEQYDPNAWTAAIQTDLRDLFGGVRYGKDYRPCYALVAKDDKQVIIKINDVGPLEPGRVIDFNEQTMRYFDPTLALGLIAPVTVTPLVGDGWLTGPLTRRMTEGPL
jgi:rare lipoprotein A